MEWQITHKNGKFVLNVKSIISAQEAQTIIDNCNKKQELKRRQEINDHHAEEFLVGNL